MGCPVVGCLITQKLRAKTQEAWRRVYISSYATAIYLVALVNRVVHSDKSET